MPREMKMMGLGGRARGVGSGMAARQLLLDLGLFEQSVAMMNAMSPWTKI